MRLATVVLAGLAATVALGLAGCGDPAQELAQRERRYQGKPDTLPENSDPKDAIYTTSTWTKGDKTSWEAALRTRALNQNEYTRVE